MNRDDTTTDRLAALEVAAPERLENRVLRDVGLADEYIEQTWAGGDLLVAYNTRGVSSIWIVDDAHPEHEFLEGFAARFGRPIDIADRAPTRIARPLERALETGKVGTLPLDLRSTSPFHRLALEQAARIPPGEVRSYGWIAREIGHPRAARAVGTAMATNPIPIVLPCHRVVRNDGSLGNYGFGVPHKRHLLSLEGLDVGRIEALAARGVRFLASDSTGVYCLPSCRAARRISDRHRVEIRSADEARALGYRPCRICLPDTT